jgi:hypothetical protein
MDDHRKNTSQRNDQNAGSACCPPCRRGGCTGRAASPVGFCAGCQRVYERARCNRERDLDCRARTLAFGNPQVIGLFAEGPLERERLLAHAVAHNAERGRPGYERIPMAAVHDYLAEAMERISEQMNPRTER